MLPVAAVLILTCGGGGAAVKPDARSIEASGSFSGSYDYGRGNFEGSSSYSGTSYGTRERGYTDQVDVEINDEGGRIRLPRVTLPIAHGGSGGWFALKNLVVTDRAISASAAVNFINNPKIYIDRTTGTISISGKGGDYSGQCQAISTDAERRF